MILFVLIYMMATMGAVIQAADMSDDWWDVLIAAFFWPCAIGVIAVDRIFKPENTRNPQND